MRMKSFLGAVVQPLLLSSLLISCQGDEAKQSLDLLMQEELQFMVAELQSGAGKAAVRPEPFYVVQEFKTLPSDSAFETDHIARVRFYYLKGSTLCQERAYRHPRMGQGWDRMSKVMIQCDTSAFR